MQTPEGVTQKAFNDAAAARKKAYEAADGRLAAARKVYDEDLRDADLMAKNAFRAVSELRKTAPDVAREAHTVVSMAAEATRAAADKTYKAAHWAAMVARKIAENEYACACRTAEAAYVEAYAKKMATESK